MRRAPGGRRHDAGAVDASVLEPESTNARRSTPRAVSRTAAPASQNRSIGNRVRFADARDQRRPHRESRQRGDVDGLLSRSVGRREPGDRDANQQQETASISGRGPPAATSRRGAGPFRQCYLTGPNRHRYIPALAHSDPAPVTELISQIAWRNSSRNHSLANLAALEQLRAIDCPPAGRIDRRCAPSISTTRRWQSSTRSLPARSTGLHRRTSCAARARSSAAVRGLVEERTSVNRRGQRRERRAPALRETTPHTAMHVRLGDGRRTRCSPSTAWTARSSSRTYARSQRYEIAGGVTGARDGVREARTLRRRSTAAFPALRNGRRLPKTFAGRHSYSAAGSESQRCRCRCRIRRRRPPGPRPPCESPVECRVAVRADMALPCRRRAAVLEAGQDVDGPLLPRSVADADGWRRRRPPHGPRASVTAIICRRLGSARRAKARHLDSDIHDPSKVVPTMSTSSRFSLRLALRSAFRRSSLAGVRPRTLVPFMGRAHGDAIELERVRAKPSNRPPLCE